MSPPPIQLESDSLHVGDLSNDPMISFVPKSEDTAPVLSPFEGIMSAASAAVPGQGLGTVMSAFDPQPSSADAAAPSDPAMTQMQIDVLKGMSAAGASNVFLSDFPAAQQQQQSTAQMNAVDDMQGILPTREESPASVHTTSSSAASPAPGPFANVSTSSLASALDESSAAQFLARSRSGSLISPNASILSNGVTRTSPPVQSNEPSVGFPSLSPEFPNGIPPPDPVNAPHMMVVDEFLTRIIKTASSARAACSLGQGAEAHAKIDDMKRQIALVSQLMAVTGISSSSPKGEIINGQVSLGNNGNAPQASGSGHTPSASLSGVDHAQHPGLIPDFSAVALAPIPSAPPSSFEFTGTSSSIDLNASTSSLQHSPDSDGSRKRCASSMAGNRINKAIRLESQDGGLPPLTQPATPPPHVGGNLPAPTMLPGQMLPPSHIPSPAVPLTGNVSMSVPANAPLPSAVPLGMAVPPMGSLPLVNQVASSHASPSAPPSCTGSPKPMALATGQPPPGWAVGPTSMAASHPGFAQAPVFTPLPPDMSVAIPAEIGPGSAIPSPTRTRPPAWPDVPPTVSMPSVNSLGGGMGTVHPQDISGPTPGTSEMPFGTPAYVVLPPGPSGSNMPPAVLEAMTRASRSNSLTTPLHNPLVYGAKVEQPVTQPPPEYVPSQTGQPGRSRARSRATLQMTQRKRSPSSSSQEDEDSDDMTDTKPTARGQETLRSSPPFAGDRAGNRSRESSRERQSTRTRQNGGEGGVHPGNEIPQEFRGDVDRIFFEFLNKICSNLDAKDGKGELIHQTLMAKKMQRLDESPDFRPFKFRIQAFTNGFLEELARQGYPEEKLAMKKVRNYLWTQPYISRFNEDGKKAKSKGNHIWNIDAKKRPDGGWEFRPFHRKLAGSPPSVAYIGLRWSWTPRIWDPQASRPNLKVTYTSPNLPSWLAWEGGTLAGTPPPDAQSCDVTVEAHVTFDQDQGEETLTNTFHINVSAVPSGNDLSFNTSRPSLANDLYNPRRVNSDSVVPGIAGVLARPMIPPAIATTQEVQMVQILETAAQRVAQEAQAVVVGASHSVSPDSELQALAKQQHVLTVTAQALDQEVNIPPQAVSPSSHALAAAGSQVVMQAARHVVAELTAMSTAAHMARGMIPPPEVTPTTVTVNEVSVATQSAVAQAVEITGPLSSEVDVMMTAKSLLQQQPVPALPVQLPPSGLQPPPGVFYEGTRPHSTGALNTQHSAAPPPLAQFPPSASSSIPTMATNF